MISQLVIISLIVLLIICIGMLLVFHWDIKKMTNQLDGIVESFGTNELVRTNTHSKTLEHFITKINRLIHLYKQDQQHKEKREKELKQEITNISHDLRTPLTSIKGFSELLTDSSLSEVEKKESLAIIQKKIDNLTGMVDLFYDLSQIDSADNQMVMEQQFLEQIVVENMLMFYDDFERHGLEIDVDERNTSSVLADLKATNRIIINIIQNALHYAKSQVTIKVTEQDEYVKLSATNDIDSFDQSELHRIFERTYRLDSSRTSGQLGLGLHIVQQLIHKQGGKVDSDIHNNEFRIDVFFKKWK